MNKSLVTTLVSLLLIGAGYISPIYSTQIKTMGFYSFSGAITNWLAIYMLFEKIPFLYGSGVITERFEEFKGGIKDLIMNQFFTQENVNKFLTSNQSSLIKIEEDLIMDAIDFDKVFDKIKEAILESPFGEMLNMFGGADSLAPLRPLFKVKFKEMIGDIINNEQFISSLGQASLGGNNIFGDRITKIVDERLNELTPEMVKVIIQDMIKKHLGWLVVWGGVFGAIIGLMTTFLK